MAIIPDIHGYFRDCGCTGTVRGGLSRVPQASLLAEKLTFVFVGWSIVAPPDATGTSGSEVGLTARIRAVADLWLRLGKVYWIAEEQEVSFVTRAGGDLAPLQPFLAQRAPFLSSCTIATDETQLYVQLPDNTPLLSASLPARNARGREVAIVAGWQCCSDKQPVVSRTLGLLAVARPAPGSAASKALARLLDEHSQPVVTHWTTQLSDSIPDDLGLLHAIDSYESVVRGRPAVQQATLMEPSGLAASVGTCATCHPRVVEAWQKSRHARALATLAERGNGSDTRCLPCHVNRFESSSAGVLVKPEHAAVTCATCHDSPGGPAQACMRCHTDQTDPNGHYLKHIATICPKERSLSGKCARR